MTKYVLQTKNGTLIKSYEVSQNCPVRDINEVHNLGREQIVIEDEKLYKKICDLYKQASDAKFILNESTNVIEVI